MSSSTDYYIWWWVGTGIEIVEKIFFCQGFRVDSFSYTSANTAYDLILSAIGNGKNCSHHSTVFCELCSIEKSSTDIIGQKREIANSLKPYAFFFHSPGKSYHLSTDYLKERFYLLS